MNEIGKRRKRNDTEDTGENLKKKKVAASVIPDNHAPRFKVAETNTALASGMFNKNNKWCANINSNNQHTVPFCATSAKVSKWADAACGKTVDTKMVAGPQKSTAPSKLGSVSANWKELLKSGRVIYHKKTKSATEKTTTAPEKANEIWFDDIDEILLDTPKPDSSVEDPLVKANSFAGLTRIIGMDCEMVGVGENGKDSILARVSIVNHFGHCIYDTFVRPTEKVTDYRTHVSGVRPADLAKGEDFKAVQQKVADLLKDHILVGHAIHNDLKVLYLSHPRKDIRDTSTYKPFREAVRGGRPSLKKLTANLLGVEVQQGEHNSIQDAQAAMRLYTLHRKEWEKSLKKRFINKKKSSKVTEPGKRTPKLNSSDTKT